MVLRGLNTVQTIWCKVRWAIRSIISCGLEGRSLTRVISLMEVPNTNILSNFSVSSNSKAVLPPVRVCTNLDLQTTYVLSLVYLQKYREVKSTPKLIKYISFFCLLKKPDHQNQIFGKKLTNISKYTIIFLTGGIFYLYK